MVVFQVGGEDWCSKLFRFINIIVIIIIIIVINIINIIANIIIYFPALVCSVYHR